MEEKLKELPGKVAAKSWFRGNELGLIETDETIWKHDMQGLLLGWKSEHHDAVRPVLNHLTAWWLEDTKEVNGESGVGKKMKEMVQPFFEAGMFSAAPSKDLAQLSLGMLW